MGKNNRHKKLERKEKSKVKLKVKKTVLTKGQNVTDTSFKVKKIIIREQLQTPNMDEPLSRRKLNVKELLSHLQHHNMSVRQDALTGLKEVVTFHKDDVLKLHLPQLVEGVSRLVLDQEKDVRRSALKLLQIVLSWVSTLQMLPLLDVLQSYLTCAMTHIKPVIQDDALLLLDALLESCPSLVAANANQILPNFLDMISKLRSESKLGRTLTIDLGRKVTSVRWRIKVLSRLNGLLEAIVKEKRRKDGFSEHSNQEVHRSVPWSKYVPLFSVNSSKVCSLPRIFQRASARAGDVGDEGQMMKGHVEVLMPLLFETWLEVVPGQGEEEANILPEESAVLLHCILRIIQLAWECLDCCETETKVKNLTPWFKTQCEADLRRYILPGFPYVLADNPTAPKAKKRKMQQKQEIELLLQNKNPTGPKCIQQNLAICHLLCCVHDGTDTKLCQRVMKYVKRCLSTWEAADEPALGDLEQMLRQLLMKSSQSWTNGTNILESVVHVHQRSSHGLALLLFQILCDLVLQPNLQYHHRSPKFKEWLGSLPSILCEATVSLKAVQTLTRLACQNNELFLENLQKNITDIVNNLTHIQVVGADSPLEGQKAIVNILFWASLRRTEGHRLIEESIEKTEWNEELAIHMLDIKALRECVLSQA